MINISAHTSPAVSKRRDPGIAGAGFAPTSGCAWLGWEPGYSAARADGADPSRTISCLVSMVSASGDGHWFETFVHKTVHGATGRCHDMSARQQEGPAHVVGPNPARVDRATIEANSPLRKLGVNGPTQKALNFKCPWYNTAAAE